MNYQGYARFTDAEARTIKRQMVMGTSISTLARVHGVSVETISRMKRGLTYRHVQVDGEEGLRSAIEPMVKPQVSPLYLDKTEEELDREAEEILKRIMGESPKGEL